MASIPRTIIAILVLAISLTLCGSSYGRRPYGNRRVFFRQRPHYNTFLRQTAMVYEKAKVETLGDIFKRHVQQLRQTRNRQVELIFLVDSSGTVGRHYFFEEIRFVRNLLSDFTVAQNAARVSVITFSSKNKVFRPVDYLTTPSADNHKCRLLGEDVPRVTYTPGGTYTKGALLEAEKVLRHARPNAARAIFLMTDGYSNGGDPVHVAKRLKRQGVKIFTFGIRDGFVWELRTMASEPKNETCYILDSFEEFEGLAKRALHADLESGTYLDQTRGKCRQLCRDDLLCCHANASCACGTYTGKYECLCRPGYYGTGRGVTGCQPCPYGTYKNATGYGDVSSCTRCPDEHQTTPLGAVSEQQCVCKRGYRQFGTNECTVFRCPKLSPPKHGYFVNNKCHNVFNAACGLRCDPGYELRGSSLRMCRDDGTWSGSDATCIMKTCPSLSPPKNGHMVCSSDDFSYSTTCRFTCNAGYKLVNSRKRDCLAISEWTGIPPRCIGITCPPLVEIRDGKIRPVTCTSHEAIFGSTCHISCSAGYTLQGPHTRQCSPDGIWIAPDEGSSKCVDQQAPLLTCPEDMVVEADQFQETTQVTWTAPVAVDNSGLRPVLTTEPAVSPGARLPQGVTTIRYLAEDLSQNVATCRFTITVVDKSAPRIDSCESPPSVVSSVDGIPVNFSQPVFSDNSGRSVEVAASHTPGDIFHYGKTSVVFQAFDMWNNNVTCTIVVEVVPHLCLPPEDPENGNVTCEEEDASVSCSVTCLPGYASVFTPANQYVCTYSEGVWEPAELFPFPDCAVKQESSDVMQPATITLEGDVNCQETQVLYQVKQLLEDKVQSELANVCDNEVSCSLEYLQILCEDKGDITTGKPDTTSRKRRRQRRSVQELTTRHDSPTSSPRKSRVSFKVMLEGQWSTRNNSESDVTRNLQNVLTALLEEAKQGQLDLTVHGKDLDFAHIDYDPGQRMLRCPEGSVAVNQSCVNCPMGTFYNATSASCVDCVQGSYQHMEGQSSCFVCPEGTSTVNPRAKTDQDCKAYCPSGAFSSSGLEPCQSCALGSYQPGQSARVCQQCNPGTTTCRRGSRSMEECAEPCPAGHVSETGLAPCFRCPHHSYQPGTGQRQCLLCPEGLVTLSSGAESVESCLPPSADQSSRASNQDHFYDMMVRDEGVVDFDACFSQPCRNDGHCVPGNGGTLYVCTCPEGFAGSQCEQRVDLCGLEPCLNEGQCLQDSGTFKCVCKNGFTGRKCETNIDDCESSPCRNEAECVDGINNFKCLCPLGYSGRTCADVTNDCTQDTCRNGGNCTNTPAGFQCACAPGFNGTSCEIDEDECQATPCLNEATCWDMPGVYRCECKQGFTGNNCETEVDECADTPCQNEAKCKDFVGSYQCQCLDGYSGEKCEKELSAHYQLDFVSPTILEYARLSISQPMTDMSLSVWFRTSDDQNQGTFFSYSVPGQPDTLTLTNYANLNVVINGQVARIGARLNDGLWHHFVFTWASVGGDWKAYSDGIVMDQNTDLSKGKIIPGQGIFIVGQEQDTLGGGFSPAETFVGSLTHLNIWDRVLALQEVEQLRYSCDYTTGNVVSWMSVQEHLHGNIAPQPTSFCLECPTPVDPQFGVSEFTELVPGSYATFECNPGYELMGKEEQRCLSSGQWEGENAFCKLINCGDPGKIENGTVLGKDFRYGKQVRYRCQDGFQISGEAVLTCEEWGDWDFELPTCEEIQCPLPALSENTIASPDEDRFKRGSVVNFSCRIGSVLHTAHDSVTCQRDGSWDRSIPSCDDLHCGPPPSIANGKHVTSRSEYNVGDSASYQCNYGFGFSLEATSNKKRVVCLPTGQWETELPECEPIKCLDPPSVPRATANGDGRLVDAMIQYTCNLGFVPRPVRKTTIKCQATGEWTKSVFNCVPVPCPDPPPLINGSLSPPTGPYRYKSSLLAACNLGYELVPRDSERVCEANKSWSGVTPSCHPVSCGQPQPLARGTLTFSGGDKYLDTVSVSCDPGYLPQGPVRRTCEASKMWKPSEPVSCVPRKCPVPPDIDFGSYSLQGPAQYGAVASYSCASGYRLEGAMTLTCTEAGSWWDTPPNCALISCPDLNSPDKGTVDVKSSLYGGRAVYDCVSDYRLEGASERTCQNDDTWSGQAPTCEATKCPQPQDQVNGQVDYADLSPGAIVRYKCNDGFVLKGSSDRECQGNLTLSGEPPSCEMVECGSLEPPAHGSITRASGSRFYGAIVSYICDPGYYLSNNQNRTCQSNGTWSESLPMCLSVECPVASLTIANGHANSTERKFGDSVEFSCNEGYQIEGGQVLTCEADGNWDQPKPTCRIMQCPELTITNGYLNTSESSFNTVVRFSCISPYRLDGSTTLVCTASAKWDNDTPKCVEAKCSTPVPISYGELTVIDDWTVKHHCKETFKLVGNEEQVCQLDGSWTPKAPICEKILCENLASDVLPNGKIEYQSNNIGDRVQYSCDKGYLMRGVSSRKCLENGSWERSSPFCEFVDCGRPRPLPNGEFNGTDFTYGSVLNASCYFGFYLEGMSVIRCFGNGSWSQNMTTCKKTICPTVDIANGQVLVTSHDVLGQAQYKCNTGFRLLGNSSTRQCLESGDWSSDAPVCERIICSRPDILSDTTLIAGSGLRGDGTVFEFGEEISNTCPEGFLLSGHGRRTCSSNGEWSGTDPLCNRVNCSIPFTPENGWRTGDDFTFESTLSYGCNTGYELLGGQSPECLPNALWSDQSQVCVKISCGTPPNIQNALFEQDFDDYTWDAEGLYSCTEGYLASGENTIKCLSNKQWKSTDFTCTIVSCQAITVNAIPNSILVPTTPESTYGSKINISCGIGYHLVGNNELICLSSGLWSHDLPKCEIMQCPALLPVRNGNVEMLSRDYGNNATFTCNSGYVLEGQRKLTCLSTGSWDAAKPVCNIVVCSNPPSLIANGRQISPKNTYVFGDSSVYKCDNGYQLVGSRKITCQASGSFNNSPPSCKRIPCPEPSSIENGNFSVSKELDTAQNQLNNFVIYTCSPGFNLIGNSRLDCLLGGTWSGESPVCRPVVCPNLSTPTSGSMLIYGSRYRENVTFSCDAGYDLTGSKSRSCQPDQTWSGKLTKCIPKFCGAPLEPFANGIIDGEYYFTSGVSYSCLPGFEIVGESYRSCQENGTWANGVPFCRRLSCLVPSVIDNGFISGPPYAYESNITYYCNDGYELQGEANRTCQASLTWSGQLPACARITCGQPPMPNHGDMIGSSYLFGDQVNISCHRGYRLEGSDFRVCQANKTWSLDDPSCKQVFCSVPPLYDNSTRNASEGMGEFPVDTAMSYECDIGYTTSESNVKICEPSGQWSGEDIHCHPVTCQSVTGIKYGAVSGNSYIYLSEIKFTCNPGFELFGNSSSVCNENGQWSSEPPLCNPIECPSLKVDNGHYKLYPNDTSKLISERNDTGYNIYGDVLTLVCDDGYQSEDPPQTSCTIDGTWSEQNARCNPVICPIPANITNAVVPRGINFTYGDSLQVACHDGFSLLGASTLTCGSDSKWEEPLPKCVLLACGQPTPVSNAYIEGDSFSQGESINYRCMRGFSLLGNSHLMCGVNNMWTGSLPVCVLVDCGELPDFQDATGILTGDTTTYGSTAVIECFRGYGHDIDPSIKCEAQGMWEYDVNFECKPVDCGQPPTIPNGRVDVIDTTFEGSAFYECLPGYNMATISAMFCEEDGQWGYDIPECRAIDCSTPPYVPHASSSTPHGTEYQAVATYHCSNGYLLENTSASTLQCQATGIWSAEFTPSCKAVDCGPPPVYPHTKYVLQNNRTSYLSSVLYQCDKGHQPRNSSMSTVNKSTTMKNTKQCSESGEWIGTHFDCEPVDCGNYPDVPNIIYHHDNGTKFGALVYVSCEIGFFKTGSDFITCESTGLWSRNLPSCLPVDCGSPPVLQNGKSIFTNTTYEAKANYVCDFGYIMTGANSPVSRCLSSGHWSLTNLPKCNPVDCSTPPSIEFGLSNFTTTTLKSRVTYECLDGYIFTQTSVTDFFCRESGLWETEAGRRVLPTCKPVMCPTPNKPINGDATFSSLSFGSRAFYTCLPGYQLVGDNFSQCSGAGTWSSDLPLCQPIACPLPPDPDTNGLLTAPDLTYGSDAVYTCKSGYRLISAGHGSSIGSVTLFCNQDGEWDGSVPQCGIVTCEDYISVDNGHFNYQNNTFGSKAQLLCNEGFSLIGSESIDCTESGVWVGSELSTCEQIQCPEPLSIENGLSSVTGLSYGSEATYTCNYGYILIGQSIHRCGQSGWDGVKPTCQLVTCDPPSIISNGKSNHTSHRLLTVGQRIKYTCNSGFAVSGEDIISCSVNGKWRPKAPQCKPIFCQEPSLSSNVIIIEDTGRSMNSTVKVICREGYWTSSHQNEISTVTCGFHGHWIGTISSCELVKCVDIPPSVPHGIFSKTGSTYASKALYTCDIGYNMAGVSELVCDKFGKWAVPTSTNSLTSNGPSCEIISCGAPPNFPNTTYIGTDFTLNGTVTYACPNGYDLLGVASSTCLFTGIWSTATFMCQIRTCTPPPTIQNGNVILSPTHTHNIPTPGHLAHVMCVDTFYLVGHSALRCMETGQWNSSWPQCHMINEICAENVDIPHSQPIPPGKRTGDQVTVKCIQGYKPTGDMTATCLNDQTWSSPHGTCTHVYCGKPKIKRGSETSALLVGWNYYYQDKVSYVCRYGHLAAHNPPILTCGFTGVWDGQPECIAQCEQKCLNGGTCLGQNVCKCLPGWAGRRCEIANCIMPCLHGGRCIAPYRCACLHGYTGPRCEEAECAQPCRNGGLCFQPNRCRCPFGYFGAFCENVRITKR